MPINFVTGLPRTGKTLFTIVHVKQLAEKEKRQVYTCNIPEVNIPGWLEIDHPDKWMDVPNGAIIIIDELQDYWGQASPGAKVPLPILELSKHGKRGIDFFIITQEPDLVHKTPRSLAAFHYYVVRAFGTETAVIHKFDRMQNHPEKIKKNFEKIIFRYPKEAFGVKDKETGQYLISPWYKSADVHNIKRKIPVKVLAIPVVALFAAGMIWAAVSMFGGVVDKAKGNKPGTAAGAPGQTSPGTNTPGQTNQAKQPMTTAELVASYQPRIQGLPQTAPRYDEITKPNTAPFPAACVQMGKRCNCFSQQGTKLDTPKELCAQIVADGFFMDWQPGQAAQPGQSAPAAGGSGAAPGQKTPAQGNPGQIAEVQLKPEPRETDKLQPVRDGQVLASMRTTRSNY